MTTGKPYTRLYYAGKATYRRTRPDRGWGGPYGQDWRPAEWVCIDCGHVIGGTNEWPNQPTDGLGEPLNRCQRNGHAPCRLCGKQLPRLNCGCPREHRVDLCPGKTEADRMMPQHADSHHHARQETTA